MAVHKVPQDVEAEDKFLGPLTFKQFLFFGGALITGFLMYQLVVSGVAFLVVLILPFFAICVTLAFPWTKDQPTELWLASRIRFLLVPHRRIWDQDDIKELVTITVPKREIHVFSDGLNQNQVESRLNALANVIDSKGWVMQGGTPQTDRLANGTITNISPVSQLDADDPYDDQSSNIAQHFQSMMQDSQQRRMQNTRAMMNQAVTEQQQVVAAAQAPAANSPWFLQQGHFNNAGMTKFNEDFEASLSEQKFLEKVHQKQEEDAKSSVNNRMKTIQPLSGQPDPAAMPAPPPASAVNDLSQSGQMQSPPLMQDNPQQNAYASSPAPVDPAILALAQNDDLSVETIARQANREIRLQGDDEVVISLHDNEE